MAGQTFDYLVVGAGSAGCALAYRLSEHARVLLLERGGPDSQPHIHDPAGILQAVFVDQAISHPYMTEPERRLSGRPIPIHRGIVRGGCSSINGMVYVRGNRRDYDRWAELGNTGWSYDEVLPCFRRSERSAEGASEYHGTAGPLDVRPVPNPSPVAQAFVEAAAALPEFRESHPDFDFNGRRQQNGAGFYRLNLTPDGRRASAAVAFLDAAGSPSTLEIRTNARATGLVIERGRAVGVRCRIDGQVQVFRAEREVILSAGAFESPRLLQLSGIGPAADLQAHGISPVVDLPGVGQNLHDHVMLLTYWPARKPTGASIFIAEAGLFVHSRDRSPEAPPDLQYHFLAGMVGLAADPRTEPNFLFCPAVCAPRSRGEVRLRSANPDDGLVIRVNYLERGDDLEVLLRGIELAYELAATAPLSGFRSDQPPFAAVVRGGAGVRAPLPRNDAAELRRIVAEAAQTVWHPVGTCRMGPASDRSAVVDPALRVHGVEGLRVADASVMPEIPRGNTNAPCIMVGERAADLIHGAAAAGLSTR